MTCDLNHLIKQALTIRKVEERLLDLFSKGKIFGTTHTCIGQEFSAIAIAAALESSDVLFSNHRCHGHYLAMSDDVEGLIAEVMGKETGVCGGVGGSQHLCNGQFFTNGIQGGIVPLATGVAFSKKIANETGISTVFMGDGTLGEGVVYESLNLAAKWDCPVLFVLENNAYAQSTPSKLTLSGSITQRAEAFGIKTYAGNTWEWEDLLQISRQAIEEVREIKKPVFLLIDTYRLSSHSKSDDNRNIDEVEEFIKKDPLNLLVQNDHKWKALEDEVVKRIDAAVESAERANYAELKDLKSQKETISFKPSVLPADELQIKRLNQALEDILGLYPKSLMMGEDIVAPYGGAFKASKKLSELFPDRVFNTPISEAAIVGLANGMSLNKFIPIVEIMFGDFMTLCFDQIVNHASKFRQMYNFQVETPIVIRTPMGAGRRYGATHSQNLEKHLAGIPDVQLFIIHSRVDFVDFYKALFKEIRLPSIVIENKLLYGVSAGQELDPNFEFSVSNERFPTTLIKTEDEPDLTIIAIGRMSLICERVASKLYSEEELEVELLFPLQLSPLSIEPLLESVLRSKRVLIVEEGGESYNFSSEIISKLTLNWKSKERYTVRSVSAQNRVVPGAGPLEDAVLPSEEDIFLQALELYHESN